MFFDYFYSLRLDFAQYCSQILLFDLAEQARHAQFQKEFFPLCSHVTKSTDLHRSKVCLIQKWMFTCTNTSDQHIKMKKSIATCCQFFAILISAQTPSKWQKMLSGIWTHSTPVTKANYPKIDLVTELYFTSDPTLHLETKNNHLSKTKWWEEKKI